MSDPRKALTDLEATLMAGALREVDEQFPVPRLLFTGDQKRSGGAFADPVPPDDDVPKLLADIERLQARLRDFRDTSEKLWNPFQARNPAGTSEGGRFASSEGGSAAKGDLRPLSQGNLAHDTYDRVDKALYNEKITSGQQKAAIATDLAARLSKNAAFTDYAHRLVLMNHPNERGEMPPQNNPDAERIWAADHMVNNWAITSGDTEAEAVAMQRAVQQEFGLDGATTSHLGANQTADRMLERNGDAYRAFARAQYDNTQQFLKEHTIPSLAVYRGMSWPDTPRGQTADGVTRDRRRSTSQPGLVVELRLQRGGDLLDADAAGHGARHGRRGRTRPARILSTGSTGQGCREEGEVVVLGKQDTVTANYWKGGTANIPLNADDLLNQKKVDQATLDWKVADAALDIDADLANADWNKHRTWDVYTPGGNIVSDLQQLQKALPGKSLEELQHMLDLPVAASMPAGLKAELHAGVKTFDPGQERDEHGRWASTGAAAVSDADIPEGYASGTPAGNTAVANARRDAADKALNDESQSRTEYKGRIAKALSARLEDNPTWQEYVARSPVQWAAPLLHVNPVDTLVGQVVLGQGPTNASEAHAADLVQSWASSSGDHNPVPVALQAAVKDEFNLKDATDEHLTDRKAETGAAADEYAKNGAAYRVFARAMYDETQADLQAKGITEMTLYRGMSFPGEVGITPRPNKPDPTTGLQFDAKPHVVSTVQQPASSWSYDFAQARNFSPEHGDTGASPSRLRCRPRGF